MGTRTRWVVAVVVVAMVALAGAAGAIGALRHSAQATRNGTGLTYHGRFYWASGDQVAGGALGPVLQTAVPFQDTTADIRSVTGFAPEAALAALLPSLNGSPGGLRWTFVATDMSRGTNPRGYPETSAVLVPAGRATS